MNSMNGYNQNWGVEEMIAFNGFVIAEGEHTCYWMNNGTPCNIRLQNRDSGAHLRGHHRVNLDDILYQCRWYGCASDPMTRTSLERHVMEQHLPGKWACPMCEETVTRKSTLRKHLHESCPGMNHGHA
ncbi:hypothetical protein BS17DRAFT_364059 [Gyrodon lividus]|nr:hypothetical protein BS17DRAFT_364059 [Gyrodon lividus]